jgi:hypothetical protein
MIIRKYFSRFPRLGGIVSQIAPTLIRKRIGRLTPPDPDLVDGTISDRQRL